MHPYLLFIIASIAPAMIILLYFYKKDRNREPMALLAKCFSGGILAAFICFCISALTKNNFSFYFSYDSSLSAPWLIMVLLPDTLKWLILWLMVRKNKEFNEHADGIVYAVFQTMGFALMIHLLQIWTANEMHGFILITLVPVQLIHGIMMGFYFALARFSSGKPKNTYLFFSWLLPVFLQGLDNFIFKKIIFGPAFEPYAMSFIVAAYTLVGMKFWKLSQWQLQSSKPVSIWNILKNNFKR